MRSQLLYLEMDSGELKTIKRKANNYDTLANTIALPCSQNVNNRTHAESYVEIEGRGRRERGKTEVCMRP